MNLEERILACIKWGKVLNDPPDVWKEATLNASVQNSWFEPRFISLSLTNIVEEYLDEQKLRQWISGYALKDCEPKKVGIIMAGNLPLVGFHDVLSVFISGHRSKIKLAQKDQVLWPVLLDLFLSVDDRVGPYFEVVEKLKEVDAVLATGSNNSARYFQYYFGKYPHIIRKNRVGVAVLNGYETDDDLLQLGQDVFLYFGLGCRNVSSLFVPRDYDFTRILKLWGQFHYIKENNSYHNNYDYNLAIYIMGKMSYLSNDVIFLVEQESLASRIAAINYQYYDDIPQVIALLSNLQEDIQVVVSTMNLSPLETFLPGKAQVPGLGDYADGIDTLKFLIGL